MTGGCAELAIDAGLRLAGTATVAERWLVLQVESRWGRDVLPDSALSPSVKARLGDWLAEPVPSRVLFVRHPDRTAGRAGPLVFFGRTEPAGGALRRLQLSSYDDLRDLDLESAGEPVDGPLVLVCTHGRRDACCARLGIPLYEAFRPHLPEGLLWQSSHQGGHRLAANVLALPQGVQLGRVMPARAPSVAMALLDGRIPLDHLRGRTLYDPAAQAAEVAVRHDLGLDRIADVRVVESDDGLVRLQTPRGEVEVEVSKAEGPVVPPSCGAEPERSIHLETRIKEHAG